MRSTSIFPALDRHDLRRLEREGGVEFVNGSLVEKPSSIESAAIEATIVWLLGTWRLVSVFGAGLGYQCFPEEPARVRKPDISAVRRDRMNGIDRHEAFVPIPPDLAIEVMAPDDRVYEVGDRIREYRRNGFGIVWIVDPNARSVSVYPGEGRPVILRENDQIDCGSLIPDFRHKVSDFFV